ncbi:hypothetical protein [Kamptonema sp. UHCC 0994]|uniref:hypothetical protein n=1 Tax=Kamptonema sp. UHCC 0994 TaxID=3031329 RepID=UPI0023B8DCDC|nr:hypothetical protein [Kamptonema sp. UHCC 0994]MDF0553397.1 hypothetical protein [Kamptonema sp. UHCC 0994]
MNEEARAVCRPTSNSQHANWGWGYPVFDCTNPYSPTEEPHQVGWDYEAHYDADDNYIDPGGTCSAPR